MADNTVNLVEKNIAFKIAQQFPAYYREHGAELVAMVEHYYKFVESDPNMGVYNSRRLFEYRDVGTTLSSMIIYFKKKYMADLPPIEDDKTVKFVIRNILDLYRRKGTEAGLVLFFRMFYEEDIQVMYPSKYMLKPSDSTWKTGTYLQILPNNNNFVSRKGVSYTYADLLSRNIYGSISKAKAIVDKINFVYLNKTLTAIIYITNDKGTFVRYDDIMCRIGGEDVPFGKLNGSANALAVDVSYGGTTGNKVGDILDIKSDYGKGGTAIVTELQTEFTGTIEYTIDDGGFGYTIDNTKLLVSNQVIVLPNESFRFKELEVLIDTAGNAGTVIGQNSIAVGVKMEPNDSFALGRDISTRDRVDENGAANNFTITAYDVNTKLGDMFVVAAKNGSSPGPLYANTGVITDVKIEELDNIESVSLITDIIGNFVNVTINSNDYNNTPPATIPMSGTASPATLSTPLNQAFDLTPFDIGTIKTFENINPGEDYINDTFSLAIDEQMAAFERYDQIISIGDFSPSFSVGDTITQALTSSSGIIRAVDNDNGAIYVTPFSYYGFRSALTGDEIIHKGNTFEVIGIERNYSTKKYGLNAEIRNETLFSEGRIKAAEIRNSGFGYIDGENVYLTDQDDGTTMARAQLSARTQGITAGFWGSNSSHINGYFTDPVDRQFKYFDSEMKVQDSDYYQEYSYVIKSVVDQPKYEKVVKDTVHLAGSKLFGKFSYEKAVGPVMSSTFQVIRKDDYVKGGDPIVGPNQATGDQTIRADNFVFTVDDTLTFTVDNS
jgi:hypothetical protein